MPPSDSASRCSAGLFEDLGKLEGQPGFVITDEQEERHFFGASSREEQKLWMACLRGLTRLDDSMDSGQVMAALAVLRVFQCQFALADSFQSILFDASKSLVQAHSAWCG